MKENRLQVYKTLEEYGHFICMHFARQDILEMSTAAGELSITVMRSVLIRILQFLRDDPSCKFIQLTDVTCVDYLGRAERFTVVYHLLSPFHNRRIRIKLSTDEELAVASVSGLFSSAVWYEREIWDMFGVVFDGHPDLRRLLTDDGFRGMPLRKDYPAEGRQVLKYHENRQSCFYEPKQKTGQNASGITDLNGGSDGSV